ncbi:MAG: dihydrofolate reductase [Cellulomonadaceae bacterium]|jgi:dihydrofolate reductase|nr:dihydrofolate reductase [Cellulomonadaceae bacterium]
MTTFYELSLIWAQARDSVGRAVIGAGNKMPWSVPEDLAHFRRLTIGHPVIMGKNTWYCLFQRPLAGRVNIVLSREGLSGVGAENDSVYAVSSLAEAFSVAADSQGNESVWVIGGGDVYRQTVAYASKLVITEIDLVVAGDTFAPAFDADSWRESSVSPWQVSEKTGTRYRYRNFSRISGFATVENSAHANGQIELANASSGA